MMMDSLAATISFRLKLFGISHEVLQETSYVWTTLRTDMQSILFEYYEFACTFDTGKNLYSGNEQALTTTTMAHFDKLFSGRFDADYLASVRQIGAHLQKIGLDTGWIIAARSFFLEKIGILISKRARWNGARVARTVSMLEKALLLDTAMILSVYHEYALAEANEHSLKMQEAIAQSDQIIAAALKSFGIASTGVKQTANKLKISVDLILASAKPVTMAAENTRRNVQSGAAATEELSSAIEEIGSQARTSLEVAQRAASNAGRTNDSIHLLLENATEIGNVVNQIAAIAAQTRVCTHIID